MAAYIVHERWWRNGDNLGVHERVKTDVYLSPPRSLLCVYPHPPVFSRAVCIYISMRDFSAFTRISAACVWERCVRATDVNER